MVSHSNLYRHQDSHFLLGDEMQILNNEDWVLKGRDASVSIVVIIIIFVLNDNLSLMREDVMTEKIQEEV